MPQSSSPHRAADARGGPWSQRERARDLLAKEVGYVRKPHGGRLRVALAFPNTYFVGMSNLGFQTVYSLFNAEDGIVCERTFLPPKSELEALRASGTGLVTLESQTLVREFDIFALSVSFEWDYTNVLTLLRLAGIPPRAADRTLHGFGDCRFAGRIAKGRPARAELQRHATGGLVAVFGGLNAN